MKFSLAFALLPLLASAENSHSYENKTPDKNLRSHTNKPSTPSTPTKPTETCVNVVYDFNHIKAGATIAIVGGNTIPTIEITAVKDDEAKVPGVAMAFDTGAGAGCTGGDHDLCKYNNGIALIISENGDAENPNGKLATEPTVIIRTYSRI